MTIWIRGVVPLHTITPEGEIQAEAQILQKFNMARIKQTGTTWLKTMAITGNIRRGVIMHKHNYQRGIFVL